MSEQHSAVATVAPFSVVEILRESLGIFFKHYGRLFSVSMIVFLVFNLCGFLFVEALNAVLDYESLAHADIDSFLSIFSTIIAGAAVTIAVADVRAGRKPQLGRIFSRLNLRFGPVFRTVFLQTLVVLLGFMLFVIPGIIASTWYAFAPQAAVLEGVGGLQALKRSRDLARGRFWKVWVVIFLSTLVMIGLTIVAVSLAITTFGSLFNGSGAGAGSVLSRHGMQMLIGSVSSSFSTPLSVMPVVVMYFHILEERGEADTLCRIDNDDAGDC